MSENNFINTCVLCKKSFDNAMEFITHDIEIHPISSWSDEVDTEDTNVDCSQSNASKKRKSSDSECSRSNKVRVIVANPQ